MMIRISLFFFCCLLPHFLMAQAVQDWVAVKDHAIEVDTLGWKFPVEIAFVPNPGTNPKDPLYYVSELRGTIKVVTVDRSIYTYAENVNAYRPPTELPSELAELGLAGICLDEKTGYLFATTIYYENQTIRNKIVRFEHDTSKFALKPKAFIEFIEPFAKHESGVSHQIGKCAIGQDRHLYVGVGDGHAAHKAQGLVYANGKVLRMTLDGKAVASNPFYDQQNPDFITSYIYAYGVRNPFPLALGENDQPYVADNGPNWDRLIEVKPGKNYLWDGTNRSMRTDGIYDWVGSVGPAGMLYLDANTPFYQWKNRLLIAQGGTIGEPGPSRKGKITINSIPVQVGRGVIGKPETLVSFKGAYQQLLVPIAEGPDGIYFSGFFPDATGETPILKMVPQKGAGGNSFASGSKIFEEKGCQACHQVQGKGGLKGPVLDGLVDRLRARLQSDEYWKSLDEAEKLTSELHVSYKEERQRLRELKGEEQIKYWISLRLKEPRFDREQSQMPNFQLSDQEIEQLTSYLMSFRNTTPNQLNSWEDIHRRFKVWWDSDYNARPTVAFILGILLTLGVRRLLSKLFKRKG